MIVIIDDDIRMSKLIKEQLMIENIRDIYTFTSTKDCPDEISAKADLIFLDIEMPHESGLAFAKRIRSKLPDKKIIFISSHEEYVFDSFIVQPFFFIRKTKFAHDFKRAIILFQKLTEEDKKTFYYKVNGKDYEIRFKSIIYFEKSGNNILIHTKTKDVISIVDNLKMLMETLDDSFVLIDRSRVLNLLYLEQIDGIYAILNTGEKLEISRRRKMEVKHSLMEYIRRNNS